MNYKKMLLIYIALFSLMSSASHAEDTFSNISLNITSAPTPIYFIQNVGNNLSMSSKNKWILFEIQYNILNNDKSASTNISDLCRSYSIKLETIVAGKQNLFLLSDTTTYTAVSLTPRTKYALFLIPPQIINSMLPTGKNFKKSYLRDGIQAKISFIKNNKTVTEYYYPKRRSTEQAFKNITNSNKVVRLNHALLNRTETPWSGINFDKYELAVSNNKF